MKWFRFWDEALDDPKCQRLSPVLFKHWVNLLCMANRNQNRGELPSLQDISFGLRVNESKAKTILRELVNAGLIDQDEELGTFRPHGWQARQRVSDNVTERVARHRSRNASGTDGEPKRNVTNPLPHVRVTDTETETEAEGDTPPATQGPPVGADAPGRGEDEVPEEVKPSRTARQRISDAKHERRLALYGAWCRAVSIDPESKEAAVGQERAFRELKPIVDAEVPSAEEFELCARYLAGQSWREDPPSIPQVIAGYTRWVGQGRPDKPAPRSGGPVSTGEAEEAWIEVLNEADRLPKPFRQGNGEISSRTAPRFSSVVIARTVDSIGWEEIWEADSTARRFIRAQFIKTFNALNARAAGTAVSV